MAGELQHVAVGAELTQAEYEGAGRHELSGQAHGDVLIVDSTPEIIRLAAGLKGEVLGAAGSAANPLWVPSGRVNLLVNPGFEIWQRGTSFTDPDDYTADRWYGAQHPSGAPDTGSITVSQDATNEDDYSEFSCKVVHDGTIGPSPNMLVQEIENGHQDLARSILNQGEDPTIPLSFAANVRVDTANVVRLAIETESGGVWTEEAGYTIDEITTVFKRFTVSLDPVPAAKTGVRVGFKFLSGVAGTANIDNCTLSRGSEVVSYNPLSKADEWARCLRYYEILGDIAGTTVLVQGYADAGSRNVSGMVFYTPKAVVPTVTKEGTWAVTNCGQPIVSSVAKTHCNLHAVSSGAGWTLFSADAAGQRILIEANP